MFLKNINEARKKISFRIWFWYSSLLVLSGFALFLLVHFFLSSSLIQQDRNSVESELNALTTMYQKEGLDAVREELEKQNELFFIRVVGANKNILLSSDPNSFEDYDLNEIDKAVASANGWITIPEVRQQDELKILEPTEVLDIATARMPDGVLLQVGKTSEHRQDLLARFHFITVLVMVPLILVVGAVLAFRSLQPLRTLINTVKAVQAGKIGRRVPIGRTQDELNELAMLFNEMLSKIENLIEGMKNSLDNVAHDLRTPITRLRAIAETAVESDASKERYREALLDCMEESDRILAMLNTLMDISEAETGSMKLNIENVSVSELFEDTVDLYQYVAEDQGLRITKLCQPDLHLTADRHRLRQVLANLLDNAVKYNKPGGEIHLKSYQDKEGEVVILVQDTGIGISEEELPRIWDRLYRSTQSRNKKGIGLGLSLVRAIVEAHGGVIAAHSHPDKGSTFEIRLKQVAIPGSVSATAAERILQSETTVRLSLSRDE
ncbi:ATP-binding protein [bacterium]|nr:ATP-binding protein [bacterium]MCI0604411.1 ATP-binding protein [bacterium]